MASRYEKSDEVRERKIASLINFLQVLATASRNELKRIRKISGHDPKTCYICNTKGRGSPTLAGKANIKIYENKSNNHKSS